MHQVRLAQMGLVAVVTAALSLASCTTARPASALGAVGPNPSFPAPHPPATSEPTWRHEGLAQSDPLEFLRFCRQQYLDRIRDYRCKFHMRERKPGWFGDAQVIAVKFREHPYSVDMTWLAHPAGAKRISYVRDRWVREGRQLALVIPSGMGGLLLSGGVRLDIHGREFRRSSARSVDEFGFQKTLERAIELCEQAVGDPDYSLTYAGRAEFDGRPHYVLERRLPFSEGGSTFPDRLADIYLDAEWLVPSAVRTYADEGRQTQLGEFLTTEVVYNVGLTDADFE